MEAIKTRCDTDGIALGKRYHWHEENLEKALEDKSNVTAKDLLQKASSERNVDVMCVGFHGRKGLKSDPTVMGTAVQYLAMNSTVPIFILKDPVERKDKEDGTYKFSVAIDGSAQSLKAIPYIC